MQELHQSLPGFHGGFRPPRSIGAIGRLAFHRLHWLRGVHHFHRFHRRHDLSDLSDLRGRRFHRPQLWWRRLGVGRRPASAYGQSPTTGLNTESATRY